MKFFRRLIPYALVILTLVLVFPLVCGCSDDSEPSNRFHELLKMIPSELKDSQGPLVLSDIASYWEDFNIFPNASDGRSLTFEEYTDLIIENEIRLLVGGPSFITGWGEYAMRGTIRKKYVGYDFTSVDAEILAGTSPAEVVAAIGRFDPEDTADALSIQDEWPSWAVEAYTIEEYRGVTVHSWGDGFQANFTDRLVPPHIDMVGRARPLAVTEEFLFYAPSLEAIELMIDASQGKTENLADLPEFAEIADGLSELNVYMALIGLESLANGDPEYEGTYPEPRLKKFVTFGSGIGQDEKGIYTALVLYHESPNDAESNVSLLEQRIADTDSVYYERPWNEIIIDAEISVDGNVLLAKLYADYMVLWQSWVYLLEPLVLHEE